MEYSRTWSTAENADKNVPPTPLLASRCTLALFSHTCFVHVVGHMMGDRKLFYSFPTRESAYSSSPSSGVKYPRKELWLARVSCSSLSWSTMICGIDFLRLVTSTGTYGGKTSKLLLFSCSVGFDPWRPQGLPHTRLPSPSLSPGACSTHVHWVRDAIHPSCPLLSPSPPAFNLSNVRVFSKESVIQIRWPKFWSFSLTISPSIEYSGLISFKIDGSDLLAVQGTLKSLFLHYSSKAWTLLK